MIWAAITVYLLVQSVTATAEVNFTLDFLHGLQQVGYGNWTDIDPYTSTLFPPEGFSTAKHVPVVRQVGASRGEVIVPHPMDPDHWIEYIWVVDQNGSLVAADQFSSDDPKAAIEFDIPPGTTSLTPFEYCNLHGRWLGEEIQLASPQIWNQTIEFAMCDSESAVKRMTHVSIDAERYIEMYTELETETLFITFRMPPGSWMGLGIGDQMVNSDMILVTPVLDGASYACNDSIARSKSVGPEADELFGGTNDAVTVEVVQTSEWVEVICSRPLVPADGLGLDQPISLGVETSFIEAHGDSLPLSHHGISNRNIFKLVVDGEEVLNPNDPQRDLFMMHGIVMSITWGVLIPIGAAIVRYQKHCVWWLGAHRLLQITGTVITIPTMLLANSLVTDHFQTPHSILGVCITLYSGGQSALGLLMITLGKMSKRLTRHILFDESIRNSTRLKIHREIVLLHQDYLEQKHKIITALTPGDRQIIRESEEKFKSTLGWFRRIILWPLLKYKYSFLNPLHRILGRAFVLLAFAQMFLGLVLLDTSPVIDLTILLWTCFFFTFVLYKEIEMRLYLPRGVLPKLALLHMFIKHGHLVGCSVPEGTRPHKLHESSVPSTLAGIVSEHDPASDSSGVTATSGRCMPKPRGIIQVDPEVRLHYREKYQNHMPGIVLRIPSSSQDFIIPSGWENSPASSRIAVMEESDVGSSDEPLRSIQLGTQEVNAVQQDETQEATQGQAFSPEEDGYMFRLPADGGEITANVSTAGVLSGHPETVGSVQVKEKRDSTVSFETMTTILESPTSVGSSSSFPQDFADEEQSQDHGSGHSRWMTMT